MSTVIHTTRSWPQRNWFLLVVIAYCLGILTTGILKSTEPKSVRETNTVSAPRPEKQSDSAQKTYEVFGNDNTGTTK